MLACQQPRGLQVPVRGAVPVAAQGRRPDRRPRRLRPAQRAGRGLDLSRGSNCQPVGGKESERKWKLCAGFPHSVVEEELVDASRLIAREPPFM